MHEETFEAALCHHMANPPVRSLCPFGHRTRHRKAVLSLWKPVYYYEPVPADSGAFPSAGSVFSPLVCINRSIDVPRGHGSLTSLPPPSAHPASVWLLMSLLVNLVELQHPCSCHSPSLVPWRLFCWFSRVSEDCGFSLGIHRVP